MSFSGTKGYITKPKPGVQINPPHPLSQGLVGYWLFNEGSGSRANDISDKDNYGILENMSANAQNSGWGGSRFGSKMRFDGSDDYIDIGVDSSLISTAGSVQCWFKSTIDTSGTLYSIGGTSTASWLGILLGDGATGTLTNELITIGYGLVNRIGYCTADRTELFDNAWHHIVVTGSSIEYKIYLDGISKTLTVGIGSNDGKWTDIVSPTYGRIGELYVGSRYHGLTGSIGFISSYNRVLSATDVKKLYHDPFCNLMQVPIRRYYVAAPPIGNPYWYYQMLRRRN